MPETDYQKELRTLLQETLTRCPRNAACSKLDDCLYDDDYERMAYCCKAWQEALAGSFDWWAHGVAHLQRGILMARDGRGRSEEALEELGEAESFFEVCDDVCAALTQLARGRILETREDRISNGKDKWTEAAQAYQQGQETLTRNKHPFADVARKWRMGAVGHLRQEAPPLGEEARPAARAAGQGAREQAEPPAAKARAEPQGAQEAAQDAQQAAGEPVEPPAAEVRVEQPGAPEAEPPPEEETKPGGPAYFYPPSYAAQLRLKPVCAGRVPASAPVGISTEMDEGLEAALLYVGGAEFYVRDTPGRKDLASLDAFDFALRVTGNSMEPVIRNGDCVLVSKTELHDEIGSEYRKGELVVARAPRGGEDEFTVKRYYPKVYRPKGAEPVKYTLLQPDNEQCPAIILLEKDEQKQAMEDYLRFEYGDEAVIIVAGARSHIEGRVSVILSPVPPEPAAG
jgi:hypothetical protein